MDLTHNQVFRLSDSAYGISSGLYRVVVDLPAEQVTVCVLIKPDDPAIKQPGGRKKIEKPKRNNQKPKAPQVGSLHWIDRQALLDLAACNEVALQKLDLHSIYYQPLDKPGTRTIYERRCKVMQTFLDFQALQEEILVNKGLGILVSETMREYGVSRAYVYRLWSTLCRFGFSAISLRPRLDRCGGKGKKRELATGILRKKSGRKTFSQQLSLKLYGFWGESIQPGMSSDWRAKIVVADRKIPIPKPSMRERHRRIIASHFTTGMRYDKDYKIVHVDLKQGEYPNYQQVKRVLTIETTWLEKILEKTSKGHFKRALRGMTARNWEGVAGPGYAYAIDSTVGDIYLRSSINPQWIVGRPIVYIIVDVWSTAIVGFYVCLSGPSWDTAQVSLFNTVISQTLLGSLWDYEVRQSLFPAPTLPYSLLCDRGEYLSKRAKETGMQLIPCLSYTPPFRPDLKGIVEVMHRILKNAQYNFLPGAMDARRAEYDLRKSNPSEATMTVRHYTEYLHECFFNYNLTADRKHRVDAHMAAAGVFPSPAGLWRWGHAVGVGYRRAVAESELITQLLPRSQARVTRHGVKFTGNDYKSPVVDAEQWSTIVRNSHQGWDIPIQYYPGAGSLIWTPNVTGKGLIDLTISEQSLASRELTRDEMADAFAYQKLRSPEIEHERTYQSVISFKRMEAIKAKSIEETRIALDRARGRQPSITEARLLELGLAGDLNVSEVRGTRKLRSEADEAHNAMMQSIFAEMNEEADDAP
jgi:putative transposase